CCLFFFSSRRRHTRSKRDWSSDVCSSDLSPLEGVSRRFIQRKSVLLPLPEGPIIATTSPLSTVRFIPFKTSFFPKDLYKFLILITNFQSPFEEIHHS